MIVPCFNEEERFNVDYWNKLTHKTSDIFWIFVNDGSTDQTLALLRALNGANVRILNLDSNLGKSEAIRLGFINLIAEKNDLDFVGYIDSDSAFEGSEVSLVLKGVSEYFRSDANLSAIFTSRVALAGRNIQRKSFRHYLGRMIITFITWSWATAPYDTQSGFKIYRVSQFLDTQLEQPFLTKWFIDIELLARIGSLPRIKILELPLNSWVDVSGSHIRIKDFPLIALDIFTARRVVKKNLKGGSNLGSH